MPLAVALTPPCCRDCLRVRSVLLKRPTAAQSSRARLAGATVIYRHASHGLRWAARTHAACCSAHATMLPGLPACTECATEATECGSVVKGQTCWRHGHLPARVA